MLNIGLDGPEDEVALARALETIDLVGRLDDDLPHDPALLGQRGSEIEQLMQRLPDPLVDIRISLRVGLEVARGSLAQVSSIITRSVPTTGSVLQSLVRSALLGAGRVVYVLGPEDASLTEANARMVLRQEARILMKAYDAFEKFEKFQALVPPPSVLAAQRARNESVQAGAPTLGEEKMLLVMAKVIVEALAAEGHEQVLTEHVTWLFNVYSGVAHGFGWPRLIPGSESMPGHFIADLTQVVSIAHFAFDMTARRTRANP